jgi:hypothetical protein
MGDQWMSDGDLVQFGIPNFTGNQWRCKINRSRLSTRTCIFVTFNHRHRLVQNKNHKFQVLSLKITLTLDSDNCISFIVVHLIYFKKKSRSRIALIKLNLH